MNRGRRDPSSAMRCRNRSGSAAAGWNPHNHDGGAHGVHAVLFFVITKHGLIYFVVATDDYAFFVYFVMVSMLPCMFSSGRRWLFTRILRQFAPSQRIRTRNVGKPDAAVVQGGEGTVT